MLAPSVKTYALRPAYLREATSPPPAVRDQCQSPPQLTSRIRRTSQFDLAHQQLAIAAAFRFFPRLPRLKKQTRIHNGHAALQEDRHLRSRRRSLGVVLPRHCRCPSGASEHAHAHARRPLDRHVGGHVAGVWCHGSPQRLRPSSPTRSCAPAQEPVPGPECGQLQRATARLRRRNAA